MPGEISICFILGTRPEIVKLSPLIHECGRRGLDTVLIHTGQHYDDNLDGVFFEQLDLAAPDYTLSVGSNSHGHQTGEMLIGLEPILEREQPDVVLVQGDTNSVLAGALTASKLQPAIGHVEAGLRSYQEDMPEETNRRIADHVADELFAPTSHAAETLEGEGLPPDRIHTTGNTVVDAVERNIDVAAEHSTVLSELNLEGKRYAVLTAHRAENVDTEASLQRILDGISTFATETGMDVVYPIHPRTETRIEAFGLAIPEKVTVVEPLDYIDFLRLQDRAAVVFTDSGGVQEEACILGVPCVTLREQTERPETVDVGANVLAGTSPSAILDHGLKMLDSERKWSNPFGDGRSAKRIIDVLEAKYDG